MTGGLYGTRRLVRASEREVRKALGRYGRVSVFGDRGVALLGWLAHNWPALERIPGATALVSAVTHASREKLELIPDLYSILKGVPGERIVGFAYFKSRHGRPTTNVDPGRDGAGLTWMAVVCPLDGRHTGDLVELSQAVFERHGLDFSITFIMVNARSTLGLIEIFYDRDDDSERARMQATYDELAQATLAAGYQQYRTSVWYGAHVLDGSPGLKGLLDSLKAAVDPDGVLAPGRYSIGLPRS